MTVMSEVSTVSHSGDGTTKTFAAPFYFLLDADLEVIVRDEDGLDTELVLNSGYTVSGAGNPEGGSVTLSSAPAATNKVIILRAPPLTQPTLYRDNDKFPAASHMRGVDRLTMQVQSIARKFGVSIRGARGETFDELPPAAQRGGKLVGFDDDGLPVLRDPLAGDVPFETKADMDADLDHEEGIGARVLNDDTAENNGIYRKDGAAGSGSWVFVASFSDVLDKAGVDGGLVRADTAQSFTETERAQARDNIGIASDVLDPDSTFAADSDDVVPTQKAVKTAFDALNTEGLQGLIDNLDEDEKETVVQSLPFLAARVKLLAQNHGSAIGNMTAGGGLAAAFDGVVSKGVTTTANGGTEQRSWIGKTLASAAVIERVTIWGANNGGFISTGDPEITWNVRGKDGAAPTSATDGTIIGTITFTDTTDESGGRDIDCFNGSAWDHVFVECPSIGQGGKRIAQVAIYTRSPTGIFRKSAMVRSAFEPLLVTEAVPAVGGQPFRFDGLSDDTAAWNQIVAGINSADLKYLQCPAGTSNISAALDAITKGALATGGWALEGAGRAQSRIRMIDATVGRFFTLGTSGSAASQWRIAHLLLEHADISTLISNMVSAGAAPDDGTARAYLPIDIPNGEDGVLENVWFRLTAGLVGFGDKTNATQAQRIHMDGCRGQVPSTCPTAIFQVEDSGGIHIRNSTVGMNSGDTSDARLWVAHLRPGTTDINQFHMGLCEFNAGGGLSNQGLKGIVMEVGNDPDGNIENAWFSEVTCDHLKESCVELNILSGTTGDRRLNNIFFNGCRLTGDDGQAVIIDHQGDADIPLRFQFNGGLLQNRGSEEGGDGSGVPIVVFTSANNPRVEGKFIGVEFSQNKASEVTGTHAAAILMDDRVDGVIVQGCNIRGNAQPDGNPNISYLVEFGADARDWNIIGNDAHLATIADCGTAGLGINSLGRNIITNNLAPRKAPLVSITTTNATTTTLGSLLNLQDDRVYMVECSVVARRTDSPDRAGWKLTATVIADSGGSAALVGSVSQTPNSGHGTWNATLAAAGKSALQIRVTGANSQTINWGVHELRVTEVG